MASLALLSDQIHARALEISARYRRAEVELIEILQEAEDHRVYLLRGHSSLYAYVTDELGLSEHVAYNLITVARKARQVPELKAQIQSGAITLSNARRVASVLTPQNQDEWIPKASTLSSRQLEKEIVRVRPKEATAERASYVTPNRVKLALGLSEAEMLKLRRVQDLLSQSQKRPVSLEETIEALTAEFLNRHDPVKKAKRHHVKHARPVNETPAAEPTTSPVTPEEPLVTRREPIPANILHQVNLRDQRRCTHTLPNGLRCNQSRWIEIHHQIPVSQGGANTPDNLITLCSTHHKFLHL